MKTSTRAMKVKRSDAAIWRVVQGDVVLLIPEEATLHALTGCGSRIWELMEGEIALSEIVDWICAEYDVEPERARHEVVEFIHKLVAMNLAQVIPEEGAAGEG